MKLKLALLLYVMSASLAGCLSYKVQSSTYMETSKVVAFDETKAVEMVLKRHPDFPKAGQTIKIETRTGGPAPGLKVNGELKTTIEKSNVRDTFVVTLTKVWNSITVNGNEAKSFWKYQVSADKMELVSSEEYDKLVNAIR